LRGENFDVFTEAHEGRPSGADMAAKAEGFVLSEDKYAMKIGINAIGESDVNNAVESAEGYGGLSAVAGEGPETFALTASEKDSDGIAHHGHEDDPQKEEWKRLSVPAESRIPHGQERGEWILSQSI